MARRTRFSVARAAAERQAAADAAPPPSGLDLWRRRSERVRRLRRSAPWVMAAVVVLVVGWLGVRAALQAIRPTTAGQSIRMSRPRFIGRDDHQKPYVLIADQATRDTANPDLVHLVNADMKLDVDKPAPATLRGDVGAFNESTRILALAGHVVFTDGSGYVFHSERARIDTYTRDVQGNAAVDGAGPLGLTRALAYAVTGRGQRVVFTGDVHSHLYNAK